MQHHRLTPRAAIVAPSDDVGNACALVGAALAGRSLGTRTKVGRALGGPCLSNGLTFAASSVGSAPRERARRERHPRRRGPARDAVVAPRRGPARSLLETSKPYVKAFAVAVVGTLCATAIGARFVLPALASALGPADAVGSIASLSAKNIGGGWFLRRRGDAAGLGSRAVRRARRGQRHGPRLFPALQLAGRRPRPVAGAGGISKRPPPSSTRARLLAALGSHTALGILAVASRLSPRAPLPAATLCALLLAAVLPSAKESRNRRRLDRAANVLSETLLCGSFFRGRGRGRRRGRRVLGRRGTGAPRVPWFSVCGTHAGRLRRRRADSEAAAIDSLYLVKCCHRRARDGGALCAGKGWDGATAPAVAVGTIGYALATFLGLATARVLS